MVAIRGFYSLCRVRPDGTLSAASMGTYKVAKWPPPAGGARVSNQQITITRASLFSSHLTVHHLDLKLCHIMRYKDHLNQAGSIPKSKVHWYWYFK